MKAVFQFFIANKLQATRAHLAVLILRLTMGGFMVTHGISKIEKFDKITENFMSFIGLSPEISLGLVIFAELVCAILLAIGFLTRLASVPLIITMFVAAFIHHIEDPFSSMEKSLMYLAAYLAIFIFGAGKFSFDRLIFGRK